MPPDLDSRNREIIISADSSISVTPIVDTPTPTPSDITYDSDSGIQLGIASTVVLEKINIPIEQNLRELLVRKLCIHISSIYNLVATFYLLCM